jgi:hypothetical protein
VIASEQNPLEAITHLSFGLNVRYHIVLFYCSYLFMGFPRSMGSRPKCSSRCNKDIQKFSKKKEIQNVLKKEKERSKNEKAIKPLSLQILKKKEKKKKPYLFRESESRRPGSSQSQCCSRQSRGCRQLVDRDVISHCTYCTSATCVS